MIITSILDLDLYKLTVGEVIFTYFRKVQAKYRMTVRNGDVINYWPHVQPYHFDKELLSLKDLSLTQKEADSLDSLKLFSPEYIQFLMSRPMNDCWLTTAYQDKDGSKPVPEASGDWCKAMLYEIFCLSISNETFAKRYAERNDIDMEAVLNTGRVRLDNKITRINRYKKEIHDYSHHPLYITEFGTRRRLSKAWQEEVLLKLYKEGIVQATSNVHLGLKHNIPIKGTFGHEYTMGMQGIVRIQDSQSEAFRLWLSHWKGKLKIALDDTLGSAKFERDFTKDLAEAYDGVRHDSGDPLNWTYARRNMYHKLGVSSKNKTFFYSDGLDDSKVIEIHRDIRKEAIPAFGVGTFFTNDTFVPVPQVVMKIIECNGQPVAKLSNNPDKASCTDDRYLEYVKHVAVKY